MANTPRRANYTISTTRALFTFAEEIGLRPQAQTCQKNQDVSPRCPRTVPQRRRDRSQGTRHNAKIPRRRHGAGKHRGHGLSYQPSAQRRVVVDFKRPGVRPDQHSLGAKSVSNGFSDTSLSVIRAIEQMIIKPYVVGPLMRSLQAGLGGFLGGSSSQPLGLDGLAAVHHGGYGPGDAISATRYIHPAYFNNASRFHSGIGPGERPAIIKYDESVLTPGEMQLAPAGASPNITFNVIEDSSRAGQREQRRNGNGVSTSPSSWTRSLRRMRRIRVARPAVCSVNAVNW